MRLLPRRLRYRRRLSWYDRNRHTYMTVQLDWPPDIVIRLTEEARQKGLSLDDYVLQTVLHQKSANGASVTDEDEKCRRRQEALATVLQINKPLNPNPQ